MAEVGAIKTGDSKKLGFETPSVLMSLLRQLAYFAVGVVISRGTVFDKYSPFGTAMMASVPYRKMWALLCGEIFGYMLSDNTASVQYISALIATVSMRWALNDLERVKTSSFYAPIVAFIPTVSIAMVMNSVEGFSFLGVVAIAIESMIASVSAYFFSVTVSLVCSKQKFRALSHQQLVCCAMTGCILIMSSSVFCVGDISVGRILAIATILFFSYYLGITGGSISGIGAGIVFSLSSQSSSYVSGAYAFGGMISGILAPAGRWAISVVFLVSHLIISLQTSDMSVIIQGLYEVIGGTMIFLLIPKSSAERFSKVLIKPAEQGYGREAQDDVSTRLQLASDAVSSVADCVSKVSEKLIKLSKKEDVINSYTLSIHEVCDSCNLKTLCWNMYTDGTLKAFEKVRLIAEEKGLINADDFTDEFKERCRKIPKVVDKINVFKKEQIEKDRAQKRIAEIKNFVSDEFSSLSEILFKLSGEFGRPLIPNSAISREISEMLKKENVNVLCASCTSDKSGKLFIQMEISSTTASVFKKPYMKKAMEKICGKELDEFCLDSMNDKIRVQISEKPPLRAKVSFSQHICQNGTLCGDSLSYFNNGAGKMVVMLSDGMGTGGKAAVDSAMASSILTRLVKAGIGFDSAIKFANFALISKFDDESLATLDIAYIDLFTGEVKFMKAGAPFSLIRRKTKVKKLDLESLPIGILPEAKFIKKTMKLEEGDVILMFSDGVISSEDDWLKNELSLVKEDEMKVFPDHIVNEAKNRQKPGYDDDITVLTVRLLANK
ncbi:MAG: SpoIIE family protein phosphatase [Oscillospiraceae bacterium]|nr:SpoIIE family protein phosphatase [Oscillospiraceae bacterium]